MLNRFTAVGRLCADPELRYTPEGKPVANFRLAIGRDWKNKETDKYDADFISCQAWEKRAEYVGNYLGKGRLVSISGRLQVRKYTTNEGQERIAHEIVCDHVSALEKAPAEAQGQAEDIPLDQPRGDSGSPWDNE